MLTYLETYEPGSVRKSRANEHCLKEHDSFKINNGKWYWHSRGFGGYSAYDYLVKVRNMEFREAIQSLLDGKFVYVPSTSDSKGLLQTKPPPKEPLILPTANKNNDAACAYLQGRGIEKDVIKRCIENGSLYEAAKTHHCVFVGFDSDKAKFGCVRSIKGDIKKDVKNSDKRFGFALPPKNPESRTLIALESPIEALSHDSIYSISGREYDGYRLSLGGVSSLAIISFLERHTEIDNVHLSLNSDKAGKEAIDRIIKELLSDKRFSHIKITVAPPPLGKDFNNTLQEIKQMNKGKQLDRSKEAVF